jgi:large subunit ribosomal protein L23
MNQERLMRVLISPHVSEKAMRIADNHRQFVFKVLHDATKSEIKNAVEMLFNVKVKGVGVVQVKGKAKNFGRIHGKRSNWKKAYIGLEEGFDISFRGTE